MDIRISKRIEAILILVVATLSGCGHESAIDTEFTPPLPRGYVAFRTAEPMTIDGDLTENAWRQAAWTSDFTDIQGSLKPDPRFRTRAKMTWDQNYLYLAAEIHEPQIWATLTTRDTVIFYDNDFEVFIDPNGDHFEYYEFEMNALNTVWDLFLPKPYRDSGSAHNEWDIKGLKSAVKIHGTLNNPSDSDTSWIVEIAMPWEALGEFAHRPAPPVDGDQWRINFSRVEWRVDTVGEAYRKVSGVPEDNWVWSPQWVIDMHQPELWGYVQFSTATPGNEPLRPDPTWAVRMALYRLYKAEKIFRGEHGHYATAFAELGMTIPLHGIDLSIEPHEHGYVATARSGNMILHETADSRCWEER